MKNPFIYTLLTLFFGCGITDRNMNSSAHEKNRHLQTATLAGGCFWCLEADFQKLPGIVKVTSGYSGGSGGTPSYETYDELGYVEAVQIEYDPEIISYENLLDYFWKHIDPTDAGGQFADRGFHYSSKIFYHNDTQKNTAENTKSELGKSKRFDKPLVTEIVKFKNFTPAEDYHQNFCVNNSLRYNIYRSGSGRDQFLKKVWGDGKFKITRGPVKTYPVPDDRVLRNKLTALQYNVTRNKGTEQPFNNEYWDNKKEGIYVDIISGEPLFSSRDKYDSGSGWPSFTRPLEPENITEKPDYSLFMKRTEVISNHGKTHLGHLFPDGPEPVGTRYCINSASLRFIPKEKMEKEGYGKYLKIFE